MVEPHFSRKDERKGFSRENCYFEEFEGVFQRELRRLAELN